MGVRGVRHQTCIKRRPFGAFLMYYVYLHINETGVFYVGCGKKERLHYQHRSALWKQMASSGFSVLIVRKHSNKQDAWELEKELITYFKPSCNKSTGGPGGRSGVGLTKEARARISKANSGERNPGHKLTKAQVLQIRSSEKTQRFLANHYGVSQPLISRILSRRSWDSAG